MGGETQGQESKWGRDQGQQDFALFQPHEVTWLVWLLELSQRCFLRAWRDQAVAQEQLW